MTPGCPEDGSHRIDILIVMEVSKIGYSAIWHRGLELGNVILKAVPSILSSNTTRGIRMGKKQRGISTSTLTFKVKMYGNY